MLTLQHKLMNMGKYIIALMGASNTGKSCVLKKLWDILPGKGEKIFNKRAKYNVIGVKTVKLSKIGMCSFGDVTDGDDLESIQSGLALMIKLNCNIIVCACHTRKQFFNAIDNLPETSINKRLEDASVTLNDLISIQPTIKSEYEIIGCGHFCDWNILPQPISKTHKTYARVGGINLTELSAKNILNLINSLE